MRIASFLEKCRKGFLDGLYPNDLKCVLCGSELSSLEHRLCAHCSPYVLPRSGELCPICACILENGHCPECGGNRFCFQSLISEYPYDAKVKSLILDYKDGGKGWLFDWFSEILSNNILASGKSYDVILFPPSTKASVKRRGFEPMALLAKSVSKKTGIPAIQCFVKTADGEKQARKGRAERLESTAKAFSLTSVPGGVRFAIIDDVATTCSTLDVLSALIVKAVPNSEVDCYTVARTERKAKVGSTEGKGGETDRRGAKAKDKKN